MLIHGLEIDPESATPVYRQIADGVRRAARAGAMRSGDRLPTTRDLARQLGINRQTVVAAYDCLAAEGWVTGRAGKGTFLAVPPGATPSGADATPADDAWLPGFARTVEGPNVRGLLSFYQMANRPDGISFAGSYPARELLPVEAFSRAMSSVLEDLRDAALVYGPTAGYLPLRRVIAERMHASGPQVNPENLLVTHGAQQAIELVFHTFLERGDTVAIEEPTYAGALSVLASIGARVIAVPVDEQGVRLDALTVALERHRPRLLYVQPTFHNPTTAVMGEARRREVLTLADRSRCIVVEDDWGAGLRLEGAELPTLHALDGGRHVIYLGTFSKKLMPGLRVGWIVAPPAVMDRLVALKQLRDCGSGLLLQAALDRFLREDGLDEHMRRTLPVYRERRDRMHQALERHFPAQVAWSRPAGGLFTWVTLPHEIDGAELFAAAQQEGVFYSSGELFQRHPVGRPALRLAYAATTVTEIDAGMATLGRLIRERGSGAAAGPLRRSLEAVPIL